MILARSETDLGGSQIGRNPTLDADIYLKEELSFESILDTSLIIKNIYIQFVFKNDFFLSSLKTSIFHYD